MRQLKRNTAILKHRQTFFNLIIDCLSKFEAAALQTKYDFVRTSTQHKYNTNASQMQNQIQHKYITNTKTNDFQVRPYTNIKLLLFFDYGL